MRIACGHEHEHEQVDEHEDADDHADD